MCGFAGLFQSAGTNQSGLRHWAEKMAATLAHRGPDDAGRWAEPEAGVAFGFRRLAIIDLSPNGHQPMSSAGGRYTMVFNGEVFNHRELRRELEGTGATFRGHGDSEVILAAFERWGVEPAVNRFVGMFAIAVWDAQRHELTLIRDRLGIKPLFVYAEPGYVSFASELRALRAGPRFDDTLDLEAVTAYLRYLYVPAPATIFRRARKLLPGHLLTIRDADAPLPEARPYWSVSDVARAATSAQFDLTDADAVEEFDRLLTEAVQLRMEADVPLGALLSGGVDSSTVVAVMQAAARERVRTFTIGFDQPEHDESAHAREIARYLGTNHTELHVDGRDALALIPQLPDMLDEPLADPSFIPTYLVCRLARRHVTVALTGDGGDELFGGYNRYIAGARVIRRTARWPQALRRLAATGIRSLSPEKWDRLHGALTPVSGRARTRLAGTKLRKLGRMLESEGEKAGYRTLLSAWPEPARLVVGGRERLERSDALFDQGEDQLELMERMMLADQGSYLPDDLLAKVDRASMAVSLEARVPLLDHRLVEFSWRLPRRFKVRDGKGKWILRQALYRRVPRDLVDREKVGFTVPTAAWLRGPLREWASDLLSPSRLARLGLVRAEPLQQAWARLCAGDSEDAVGLWAALLLTAWQERYSRSASRTA
jgi:asparagine synthase (glutamine-hydrolysing)